MKIQTYYKTELPNNQFYYSSISNDSIFQQKIYYLTADNNKILHNIVTEFNTYCVCCKNKSEIEHWIEIDKVKID